MWLKAEWMQHPVRLEFTLAGLQVKLANHYTRCPNMVSSMKLYKVKLVALVEGDPKDPFSIATTPRCRALLRSLDCSTTLDPYLIMLSVKQGGIKYPFLSLWYDSTWDWTPVSWTLANPLLIRPITCRPWNHISTRKKKDWLRHWINQQRLTCRKTNQPTKQRSLNIEHTLVGLIL